MLRKTLVVLAVALLALPALSDAPALEQGDKSLSVGGMLILDSHTTLGLSAEFGVMTTPQLEIGPRVYVQHDHLYNPATASLKGMKDFMIGAFARWRAPASGGSIPYLTVGLDYTFGDWDSMALISASVGVDWFVTENAAIFLELQGTQPLKSGYDAWAAPKLGLRFFIK